MDNFSNDLYSDLVVSSILDYWNYHALNYYNYTDRNLANNKLCTEDMELFKKVHFLYTFRKATDINNIFSVNNSFLNLYKSNPKDIFLDYISFGYFRESTIDEILMTYTVNQLKTFCTAYNVKSSGNKSQIVSSLISSPNSTELFDIFKKNSYYSLSDKGIELLNTNNDIVQYIKKQNLNISIEDFFRYRYCGNRIRTYNDTVFQILSEKLFIYDSNNNYLSMEIIENEIAKLLVDERKYSIAIEHIYYSFFLHFSFFSQINIIFQRLTLRPIYSFCFSLNLTQALLLVSNYINKDDFHNSYFNYLIKHPPCFLTENELYSLLTFLAQNNTSDIQTYIDIVNKRLLLLETKIKGTVISDENKPINIENNNTSNNDLNYNNEVSEASNKNYLKVLLKTLYNFYLFIKNLKYTFVKRPKTKKSYKSKSKWISLVLCICTICGHKFYEGKIGMGFLYLFTGGLFFIGWIIDIISLIGKPNPYYV